MSGRGAPVHFVGPATHVETTELSASTVPGSSSSSAAAHVRVEVPAGIDMVSILGPGDERLRALQEELAADLHVRGNQITIRGAPEDVDRARRLVDELVVLVDQGRVLDDQMVRQTLRMIRDGDDERPSTVLSEALLTHRGRTIRPKTLGQKRYLDKIRDNTVTFGIGPAGTGKTYLAMGMAVLALRSKSVNRLVLTRPAVEAGERLGFLPGTLHEKIDPYLKPLWDALRDMMETDELINHVDRGTIEVAPLAYMRGRAQPVDQPVVTPTGMRPIGSLAIGDEVIGADGRATRVTGVFPQGRKPVFRVTTQDGASTRACGEHLWTVWTRYDRRASKGPRVVSTEHMRTRLRTAHYRNYELPMAAPVAFAPREVELDPYALGLLLGDGCITGATTPSFTSKDRELVEALDDAIGGMRLRHRGGHDYAVNRIGGGAASTLNQLTGMLRSLELDGTNSATKFIPVDYLLNDAETRLAVLQGLLDTDGGPVLQKGRTCRIQYTTVSDQLRDDVVFLVQSLGGVAYTRTRSAEGRRPWRANGRPVHHRHDAHIVDIRLPEQLDPFRLERKLVRYREDGGGGRPLRFIESIEADGSAETVCISVSAGDSLYLTDDFLVTHNTLNGSFIVLDEAQNTTPEQMKMFLTRIGFGSKAVVTGDVSQTDLPGGQRSGLKVVRQILKDIDGVAFAELDSGDVVRHHIVQRIVEAYERFGDDTRAGDR